MHRTIQKEIQTIIEKNNLSGKIIEIIDNEKQFVLVLDENINKLYKSWFKYLRLFRIILEIGETEAGKGYYILCDPSEALKKVKSKEDPANSTPQV
jgi:hypothetical protein